MDGVADMGRLIEVLQVTAIADERGTGRRALAIGKEAVGGAVGCGIVDMRVFAADGEPDIQVGAAAELALGLGVEAGGVARQAVEHPRVAEGAAVDLLKPVGRHGPRILILPIGQTDGKRQRVLGRIAAIERGNELFRIDNRDAGIERVGGIGLRDVAAIVADDRAAGQTVALHAQQIERLHIGGDRIRLAVKHAVDAAAVRVILDMPLVVPKLEVDSGLGQDGIGRIGEHLVCITGFQGGLDIAERIVAQIGVGRDIARSESHLFDTVAGVGAVLIQAVVAGGAQLRHAVLRGDIEDLGLAVQLLLAQVFADGRDGEEGNAHQDDEHGHDNQQLREREAGAAVILLLRFAMCHMYLLQAEAFSEYC